MATKCRVPKIMFNQIFLQKFGTCLGVQYFALLFKLPQILRQTDILTIAQKWRFTIIHEYMEIWIKTRSCKRISCIRSS